MKLLLFQYQGRAFFLRVPALLFQVQIALLGREPYYPRLSGRQSAGSPAGSRQLPVRALRRPSRQDTQQLPASHHRLKPINSSFKAVLQIRDVYPGSEFFPSRIPDLHQRILTQKLVFYALGNMIRVVHPGSGSWFFTHPGSRDQKGTGSRIRIRNTGLPCPIGFLKVIFMRGRRQILG